jgi:hypothetical protein
LDTSDPAPAPTLAPESNTTTTDISSNNSTVDLECDLMRKNFTANNLVLTLAVKTDISNIEIDYATAVLEKTYTSLLANELAQSLSQYCDPYCRQIESIIVLSSDLVTPDGETSEARQQQDDDCDATLVLTFGVEGTYVGCEDTEFPGLFTSGRRQLVQIQASKVRRNLNVLRVLQDTEANMEPDAACGSCPNDSNTLGLPAPTVDAMSELLSDFVEVLPSICAVTDAQVVAP